ncbi:MAG: hypothetical protein JSS87_06240 [Acidobacteria bacterium]|nr:hypothetical protein [Acidobacteriota bacterium]
MKILPFSLLLFATLMSAQTSVVKDKQHVRVSGVVEIRGGPNKFFYVLKVPRSYTLAFSKEEGGPRLTQEIAFAVPNKLRDQLITHIGEEVTVEGEMWLEPTSPYYWNGNMVQTTAITLANGSVLRTAQRETCTKPDEDYTVRVTIPTTAASWHYEAVQKSTQTKLIGNVASCSTNGGGDVINCFCAEGFMPTSLALRSGKRQDEGQIFTDMSMAQIGIDEDRKATAILTLKCRKLQK